MHIFHHDKVINSKQASNNFTHISSHYTSSLFQKRWEWRVKVCKRILFTESRSRDLKRIETVEVSLRKIFLPGESGAQEPVYPPRSLVVLNIGYITLDEHLIINCEPISRSNTARTNFSSFPSSTHSTHRDRWDADWVATQSGKYPSLLLPAVSAQDVCEFEDPYPKYYIY